MSLPGSVPVRATASRIARLWPLASVLVLFVVAVAITGPFGDFPLNDDWSFGSTARKLAQSGVWIPTDFASERRSQSRPPCRASSAPAVPLVYGLVRLLQGGPWVRRLAMAGLPVLICALALLVFNHWLVATGKVSGDTVQSQAIMQSLRTPSLLAKRLAENLTTALLYTGLFSLPVLLVTRRPPDKTIVLVSAGRMAHADAYGTWLPPLARTILVLRRAATPASDAEMPIGQNQP